MNSFHLSFTVFVLSSQVYLNNPSRPKEGRKEGRKTGKEEGIIQACSLEKNVSHSRILRTKKATSLPKHPTQPKTHQCSVFSFQVALRIPAFGMLPSKICRSVVAVPAAVTAAWTQLALAKSAAFFGKSMKSPKESMKSRTIL